MRAQWRHVAAGPRTTAEGSEQCGQRGQHDQASPKHGLGFGSHDDRHILRAAADHFKTVIDATQITLILSGLPKLQGLIDGNEQLRDRALKSVSLLPYSWSAEDGRTDFNGAFQAAIEIMQEAGAQIEFDPDDIVRRIYGASGGRVGVMLRILTASVSASRNGSLSFTDLRKGALATVQTGMTPDCFFHEEQPSDRALVRSYVKVMQDAGLDVEATNIHDFAALKVPA